MVNTKNKPKADYEFDGKNIVKIDEKTGLPEFNSIFNLSILILIAILLILWFVYVLKFFIYIFLAVYVITWIYNKLR